MLFIAHFQFSDELNDFLARERKKQSFSYEFTGSPGIKDIIEAIGVPHTEIGLIKVNGTPVDFAYQLKHNDIVSVYPINLRAKLLKDPKFILDVHLGKLAKNLRLLGFDSLYNAYYQDNEIIATALEQKRIILTKDKGILKNNRVKHGYWIRNINPKLQLVEVVKTYSLLNRIMCFSRCLVCNGLIKQVDKSDVISMLPEKTNTYYSDFFQCTNCHKVYWHGAHYNNMLQFIDCITQLVSG